jgi:hypothetical protein
MGIYWGPLEPKRTFQRKNKLYGSIEAKQKGASTDQDSILCCGLCCILCRLLDGDLRQRANASPLKCPGLIEHRAPGRSGQNIAAPLNTG